jgi:O-antigen/teichoic acid export membrane protein
VERSEITQTAMTARVRALFAGTGHLAVARRMASTTFLLRAGNAGLALVLQVLLARWMGAHQYGLYAYAWVWVLLGGGFAGVGLSAAAQRLIPEYREREQPGHLLGFARGGAALAIFIAAIVSLAAAFLVHRHAGPELRLPLLLACACIPLFVAIDFQEGLARAHHWAGLAFVPAYLAQPLLILVAAGLLAAAGWRLDAAVLLGLSFGSLLLCWLVQWALLRSRLGGPDTVRRFEPVAWLTTAWPLLLMNGFYLLLTYVDVLVLERFVPAAEVARYFAAAKLMSVMSFIMFAVQAASAARFAEYHVAGDVQRLSDFARTSRRWTLWPSAAVAVLLLMAGWPLLWLFGPDFTSAFHLLPLIGAGLLARAAAGPVEPLLAMAGQQKAAAAVAALALLLNLSLNLLLVPVWGAGGAAVATSLTLVLQSAALVVLVRRRLGIGLV